MMLPLLLFLSVLAYLPNLASFAHASPSNLTSRQTTSCECGYIITNRNNAYFRFRHVVDFSTLNSVDEVRKLGWVVADGWQAGGVNDLTGQAPIGDLRNVYVVKGEGLALKVPRRSCYTVIPFRADLFFPGSPGQDKTRTRNNSPHPKSNSPTPPSEESSPSQRNSHPFPEPAWVSSPLMLMPDWTNRWVGTMSMILRCWALRC